MKLTLAKWLKEDYETDGKSVYAKKDEIIEHEGNKIVVDKTKDFWIRASKNQGGFVSSCSKILLHTSCIKIAKEFNMDLEKITTKWLMLPGKDNNSHALVELRYPGCMPVLGEANNGNLAGAISSYSATMALKRGIDRIITHFTGLYEKGFLSEEELGGPFSDNREEAPEVDKKKDKARMEFLLVCGKYKLGLDSVKKYLITANPEIENITIATATADEIYNTIKYITTVREEI